MNAAHLVFLALAIWREASHQSAEAQAAVGHCIIERVRHPGAWGSDLFGVLFKRWEYPSLTSANHPGLIRWPTENDPTWRQCVTVAQACYAGSTDHPALGADSYHDSALDPPPWTRHAVFIRQIGRLKFYQTRIPQQVA